MSAIISVRVPRWLKEKCKELGINISETVRKALEEEVRKREEELLCEAADKIGEVFSKLSSQQLIELIKEDRRR